MAKCVWCGNEISDEEFRQRYDALCKLGIIPMMIAVCKSCRENRVKTDANNYSARPE